VRSARAGPASAATRLGASRIPPPTTAALRNTRRARVRANRERSNSATSLPWRVTRKRLPPVKRASHAASPAGTHQWACTTWAPPILLTRATARASALISDASATFPSREPAACCMVPRYARFSARAGPYRTRRMSTPCRRSRPALPASAGTTIVMRCPRATNATASRSMNTPATSPSQRGYA
jgi:hypothetical protein